MAESEVLFTTCNASQHEQQPQGNNTNSGGNNDQEDESGGRKAGPETATSQDLAMEATSSSVPAPSAAPQDKQQGRRQQNAKANPASWSKQRNNGNNPSFHNNHYRNRNRRRGANANAKTGWTDNFDGPNTNNNASDNNAPGNANANQVHNSNNGGKRAHKRPRRHHKRNSSAKRLRRNTQPAPNNNNEFLMKEHDDHFYYNNQLVDNGNKSLPFLSNGQQHHRQRSYSSSQDDPLGLDMLANGGDQFSSTSDEEEEAYLVRDFSNAYEVVHTERLNTMTKPQLIQEYQLLEERVESLEYTLRTVLEEKNNANIHMDRSGSSSGAGDEYIQQSDKAQNDQQNFPGQNQMEVETGNCQDVNQQEVNTSTRSNVALNYGEEYYNSSDEDESRNSGLLLTSTMLSQFQQELFRLRDENRKLRSDNKVLLKGTGTYHSLGRREREAQAQYAQGDGAIPGPAGPPSPECCSTDEVCDTGRTHPPNLASSSYNASPRSLPAAIMATHAHNSTSPQPTHCDDSEDSRDIDGDGGHDFDRNACHRGQNETSTSSNDVSSSHATMTVSQYATMTSPCGGDDNVSSTAIP